MKMAIKGHASRGNEVIQILESLGGINRLNHNGHYTNCFYYVAGDDNTIAWTCVRPQYRDVFTLEEFEKEFPFKIGDRVITITTNLRGIITNLKENGWYYVKCDNGHFVYIFRQHLKLYKEMKEERNITLTLEKAKEWYQKGGELKEIALQAFTEKELIALPRSWKEFCDQYSNINDTEYFIDNDSNIERLNDVVHNHCRLMNTDKNICPSQKSAEAHLAMIQLEQLRDCYNNSCNDTNRIAIINNNGNIELYVNPPFNCFLTFKNHLLAREFFSNFKEIIEIAKKLI